MARAFGFALTDPGAPLDHRAHNPILAETGFIRRPTPMPWFYDKKLIIRPP